MRDAASTVAFARAHARRWGADPARLFLMGRSAGAHIAVLLALNQEMCIRSAAMIAGCVASSASPGLTIFFPFTDAYLNDAFGRPRSSIAPSRSIMSVPMRRRCCMHGLADKRVSPNNTRSLTARLEAAGDDVSTQYFPDAGHGDLAQPFRRCVKSLPCCR